jgi:thioredoxin-dependent peroxiredoxin
MTLLQTGSRAPVFEAVDQNGATVRLSDYVGHRLFVYFYPKANTSG